MSDAAPTRETRPTRTLSQPLLAPGQVVGGYEVSALIGRGGMGEVYKARQLSMDREVALKILSPRLALKDPSFAKRFVEEARAAGKLNHPNIIHVHDVSTATLPDGAAVHFFSMEFIDGESVQDLLDRAGRLTRSQIAQVMAGVAEALSFAAKVGIVHRDIKPDNIMITKAGLVKVADLGLAIPSQSGDDHNPERDEQGRAKVMGTPLYLSPEQARALPVDHRSDQYSLGATLFHLITGDAPYRAADAKSIMKAHVLDPIPDPIERFPAADPAWSQLAVRLLQKKPEDRFTSPDDLIEAVEAASNGVTLEQLARRKLGFQVPTWGWYAGGSLVVGLAFWALMARGNGSAPELPAPEVPPTERPSPKTTAPKAVKSGPMAPDAGDPPAAGLDTFDAALLDGRLKDAQAALATADATLPATVSAAKRLTAARTDLRKTLGARIAGARAVDLDALTTEVAAKPLPDEDQVWLRTTIEARRKDVTRVASKGSDADRWKDLARQLDKQRATLGYDAIKGVVNQAAVDFQAVDAKAHLAALANLGALAQTGEGALRAFIAAAHPPITVVISGANLDVVLNRLTRTEIFYISQAEGAPATTEKSTRGQVGMPWAELLDEALKDQSVENAPQVKAACLWMWALPEAKTALTAIADTPVAKAIGELDKNRK